MDGKISLLIYYLTYPECDHYYLNNVTFCYLLHEDVSLDPYHYYPLYVYLQNKHFDTHQNNTNHHRTLCQVGQVPNIGQQSILVSSAHLPYLELLGKQGFWD